MARESKKQAVSAEEKATQASLTSTPSPVSS